MTTQELTFKNKPTLSEVTTSPFLSSIFKKIAKQEYAHVKQIKKDIFMVKISLDVLDIISWKHFNANLKCMIFCTQFCKYFFYIG